MMVDVGVQSGFVDTQDSTLTNSTDNKTYIQSTDVTLEIDSNVTKHHLTDDTVHNVFDLYTNSIQGNMWVTTSEWEDLVDLTVDVNGVRPIKNWFIFWTSQSDGNLITFTSGQLKTLRVIDSGIGAVKLFFRIENKESIRVI